MLDVPAMILAGGFGTRLRSVLPDTPKVMARVGGRPFLAFLLDSLADAGVREVILCTGYKAEQVGREFGASYRRMRLYYSWESQPLGTGGALRQALGLTSAETVLALNGDSYVSCDLKAFHSWHRDGGFVGSLALARVDDCSRFGTVRTDENGIIQSFDEKRGRPEAGWINAGVYLLSRRLLESLPEGCPVSIERDAFPSWLPHRLGGYSGSGAFLDIGTPESFARAEAFLAGQGTAS
jgi:D-glycero-alpha-D-manno-heptose 1-phosphate guanylyltransferase